MNCKLVFGLQGESSCLEFKFYLSAANCTLVTFDENVVVVEAAVKLLESIERAVGGREDDKGCKVRIKQLVDLIGQIVGSKHYQV